MKRSEMPITGDMAIEYVKQVNRINKQLQRLEKRATSKTKYAPSMGGNKILNYAYRGAMIDIKELFGETTAGGKQRKRFSKALPANVAEYQAVMNAIKSFYDKPTSTLTGIAKVYKRRAKALSQKYNIDITADELADIFDSGLWDAIANNYGSETTMEMVIEVREKSQEIKEKLKRGEAIEWSSDYSDNFENISDLNSILERYLKGNAGT